MRAGSKDSEPHKPLGPVDIVAGLVGLAFLFPTAYMAWGAFSFGGSFVETLISPRTLRPLLNSLLIAGSVTLSTGVLGTALAWAVARTDVSGRRLLATVLPLPLVIPSFVGATAFLVAFGRGGLFPFLPRIEGFWGAFIVLTLLSYPYVYLPVAARLATMSSGMEEVAAVLDGRFWRTALRVIFPQVRGSAAAGMLLVFLYVLSDFGAVALMRFDAITRAIYSSRLLDRGTSLTLGLLLGVLALGAAAAGWRLTPRSRPATNRLRSPVRYSLRRWRAPVGACAGVVVVLGFLAPMAVFATWAIRGSATIGVGFSGPGDDLGFLVRPLLNTALAGIAAAVAATVIVLPVAYAAARPGARLAKLAATSVSSVFALPGLVVALAIVFWALQGTGPLAFMYQTLPLLVLGYVLHFGAQSMTATRAGVAEVPSILSEAARTLGAGCGRRFATVELPLFRPALVAGGGLVMLSTMKELPATLLLAPTGFPTLATQIWGAAEDGFFAEVGLTSLMLVLLSWMLTWLLVIRRRVA